MTDTACAAPGRELGFCLCLCHQRARAAVVLAALWASLIILRLGQIMLVQRQEYLGEIASESWIKGMLPAERGRLLDATGIPLAWSVWHLKLEWEIPEDATRAEEQWRAASAIGGLAATMRGDDYLRRRGTRVSLADDIPAACVSAVRQLVRAHPAFSTQPYYTRQRHGSPALQREIGEVLQRHGVEIGISGYEKAHDGLLRGRPGIFRVMVDPHGEWLMETWEKVQEMQTGYDVFLPVRVAQ